MITEKELTRRLRAHGGLVVSQRQIHEALEVPPSTFYNHLREGTVPPLNGMKLGMTIVLPVESAIDWCLRYQREVEKLKAKK